MFSEQLSGGSVAFHERLIDDDYFRSTSYVAVAEFTSRDERNAHGPEIIRSEPILLHADVLTLLRRVTFNGDVAAPVTVAKRAHGGRAHRTHARHHRKPLLQVAVKAKATRSVVAVQARVDRKREQLLRVESRILVHEVEQTASKEASADEQQQR